LTRISGLDGSAREDAWAVADEFIFDKKMLASPEVITIVDACMDNAKRQIELSNLSIRRIKQSDFAAINDLQEKIQLIVAWSRVSTGRSRRWKLLLAQKKCRPQVRSDGTFGPCRQGTPDRQRHCEERSAPRVMRARRGGKRVATAQLPRLCVALLIMTTKPHRAAVVDKIRRLVSVL
jgi:hypothetical protein